MFSNWLRKINSTKTLSSDNSTQIMTSYFFCQDAKQNRQIITVALINQFQQAILHHVINRKKCLTFPMYDTQNELLQCLPSLIKI